MSIFPITVATSWNWNATTAIMIYVLGKRTVDALLRIQNEADVYEPNHEGKLYPHISWCFRRPTFLLVSFWGKHYARLLQIKQK